jgi:hypothetical protein
VLVLRHHVNVLDPTVILAAESRHQLLHGQRVLLQPWLVPLSSLVTMEAVLEVGVLRKAVHTADLLRDGHNHLVKQESVALAVCKREVQHVPDALDPHSKSLALLQFAGCPQILAN